MNMNLTRQRGAQGFQIGPATIAARARVYVIAEAGVNHNGDLDTALRMVDVAVDAGADAVKFQCFRASALASRSAVTAAYQQVGGALTQLELLERLELSDAQLERVRARCAQRGIEFLATPFSISDLRRITALGVRAIKIASTDINNAPLLEAACETGLPLLVSTGAATRMEIAEAVDWLRGWGAGERLCLLHCVSCYPAAVHILNLRAIAELGRAFAVPIGFSDHSVSPMAGAWAVSAGARVLEKHFTLDRRAPGPDHAMSLDPADLRHYVAAAREAEAALGEGRLGMHALEAETRRVSRKSLVAACSIPPNTPIRPEMLTIKRPDGGISPADMGRLIGRSLRVAVDADTVLTWDLLD